MSSAEDIIAQALQGRAIADERDVAAQVLEALLAAGTVEYAVRYKDGTVDRLGRFAAVSVANRGPGRTRVQRRVFPLTEEWTTT